MQQASLRSVEPIQVILLEDDDLLRDQVLAPNLIRLGFAVSALGHPDQLAAMVAVRVPDIVVLDIGLPDRDGFDVTRELRAQHGGIGVVMLTGRGGSVDRVRGLSEGADAYLAKPVDIDVLAATLHSLARRLRHAAPTAGMGWRMDASGWCLQSPGGESVAVTKAEARLLSALLENPNEVKGREDLIARLTDNTYDFDPHRLDSLVHRLRQKVRKVLGLHLPLNSVHGEGYVIVQQP
ncbi:MAG TPA: response regulator transcription factor [Rhodanobacter sp.]|nr:response regulator transcription factor [Rhodanobacter sp.]